MQTPAVVVVVASIAMAVACAAALADVPAGSPDGLYSLALDAVPGEHGESVSMALREVKREAEFSIVDIEATLEAGRSPAAALFLVRGLCGLMLARGRKVAVAEQVSDRPIEFKVSFPESASVEEPKGLPRMVLAETSCARFLEQRQ